MEKLQFTMTDRAKDRILTAISDIFKVLVMLAFVFPFYWMVISSFKTYNETIMFPPTLWPKEFTIEGWRMMFETGLPIGMAMRNTVVVTLSTIALQLVIMIPAAYAFAKRKFPLSGLLFGAVLVAFMIPVQVTYIPIYLMMSDWGLMQTLWPQIIPHAANAFGIFNLRQAFKTIPDEIVESAKLDSASEVQIMLKIMLPMCKSAMVTIAMFSFIGTWNSYFWPLIMTNNDKLRPLTICIQRLKDAEAGTQWHMLMAGNCLLTLPILVVFVFASRKIIEGFGYKGMK